MFTSIPARTERGDVARVLQGTRQSIVAKL